MEQHWPSINEKMMLEIPIHTDNLHGQSWNDIENGVNKHRNRQK